MSSSSNRQSGQDNVGTLLRRMTLANLGLDDLDGVDAEGRAVLHGADRFAAQMDRHVGRLDHVGAQLRVLPGMPEFMVHVQERYVPMHVDTDFGMAVAETDGPRTHTDVGSWYRLLDAIQLLLFDEEEGDYVVKSRGVSRSSVRQAAAAMARRGERPRSLFESQRAARPSAAASDPRQPGVPSAARRTRDYLSLSTQQLDTIFGRASRRRAKTDDTEREWLSTDGWDDTSPDLRDPISGLPGVRAFERAELAGSIARRHDLQSGGGTQYTRPDQSSAVGTSMLGSLRSVRPLGGPSRRRSIGASIGFALEGRTQAMRAAGRQAEGFDSRADVDSFDPRIAGIGQHGATLAEVAGVQREGYRYLGASSGSLLAMVPDGDEAAAVDALYRGGASRRHGRSGVGVAVRQTDGSGHTVSAYPEALGRAGAVMQRLVEPAGASASLPQSTRQAHASDGVRTRLLGFSQIPGSSGALFQTLADEPTMRVAAAAAGRGGAEERAPRSGGRLLDALLSREPSLPSSLGFEAQDLLATFDGALAQRVAARLAEAQPYRYRFMGSEIDGAEPVRRVDADGVERDATARRAALRHAVAAATAAPMGTIERAAHRGLMAGSALASSPTLDGAAAATGRSGGPSSSAVYGDLAVSGTHLRSLTTGLQAVVRSFERATRMAAGGATVAVEAEGSSREEGTFARLDRMLSLVRAGGGETTELRQAVSALRRAGEVARSSRLAWMGEDPILIASSSERAEGGAQRLRSLVESGLRPEAAAAARRDGVAVVSAQEVAPRVQSEATLARRLDRFADVARMFSLPQATRLLMPELADATSPMVVDMLRESMRGELRRQQELREAVVSSRPTPSFERSQAIARELGRPTLADTMVRPSRESVGRLSEADVSAYAGRWTQIGESMSRVGGGGDAERLEIRTGFSGLAFDHDRVAVTMKREPARGRRNELSTEAPTRRMASPVAAAQQSSLGVHLSAAGADIAPGGLGVNAARAERFEPRVLGLARFEDRVAAELGSVRSETPRLLRGFDEEPRAIRIFGESGDVVRVSYGPEVLARMVAAESKRRAVLDSVTMSDVAAGRLDEAQRREVARSVLGAGRVEVFERLIGGSLTEVDPARVMEAVEASRRRSVPIEQLQGALREALGSPTVSRGRIAHELQRRIAGLDLSAVTRPRREGGSPANSLGLAYREIELAMDRFGEASASRPRREVGYFGSLVPGGFDASAPSRALASAYGSPMQEMLRMRAEGGARLPIESLRLSAAAFDGATRDQTAGRPMRLRDAATLPGSSYEVVRASGLSRMLGRFANEGTPAAGRARFESVRGEPGQLGGTLETFLPTVATRRRATFFSAQRAMTEPVLAHRVGGSADGPGQRRGGSRRDVSRGRGSRVADALEVLRGAEGESLLGALGDQVVSRMAERGAPVAYVESGPGLSEAEVRSMFEMGSGPSAQVRAGRHDDARMLGRIEDFLVRARSVSERGNGMGGSPGTLAAVARHLEPSARSDRGLPSWSSPDEKVKGVALDELREMLRQVGATPVQGGQTATERALVDPSGGGAGQRQAEQPAPLFSARDETMPANQVRNREQAQRTSDTGKPSAADLEIFARAVYDLIKEKLRDQLFRARST